MTTSHNSDSYYIYALLDPVRLRVGKNYLQSAFYVGKGKGGRFAQHEKEVRRHLEGTHRDHERLGGKAHRIREILERGETVPALILAQDIPNAAAAYAAESLAMTLLAEVLSAAGLPPLTNAIPGHNQEVIHVRDEITDLPVHLPEPGAVSHREEEFRPHPLPMSLREIPIRAERLTVSELRPGTSALLVKGTRLELSASEHRVVPSPVLPPALLPVANRLKVLRTHEGTGQIRTGWDPDAPWDDLDARERGRRYWRLSRIDVARWIEGSDDRPDELWLGIPTASGETVVRYIWKIDYEHRWEWYSEDGTWGVPLGARILRHPVLARSLREIRGGREVQVLKNYAAGWRHIIST
jgi:hypothetical protein